MAHLSTPFTGATIVNFTNRVSTGVGNGLLTIMLGSVFPSKTTVDPVSSATSDQSLPLELSVSMNWVTKSSWPPRVRIATTIRIVPRSALIHSPGPVPEVGAHTRSELRRLFGALHMLFHSLEEVSASSGMPYSGLEIRSKVETHGGSSVQNYRSCVKKLGIRKKHVTFINTCTYV